MSLHQWEIFILEWVTLYKPEHNFFYGDPQGKFKSIFGHPVTEVKCQNIKDFKKNVGINKHNGLYESDIRPLNKTLAENYTNAPAPKLQTAFIDIESDFDPKRGYSSPQDPYSIITAIGILIGALFFEVWSANTTFIKTMAVFIWTIIFLIALFYADKNEKK